MNNNERDEKKIADMREMEALYKRLSYREKLLFTMLVRWLLDNPEMETQQSKRMGEGVSEKICHLTEYLKLKDIEVKNGLCSCFTGTHEDKKMSCKITNNSFFYCYSCGAQGDLYDAVMILEKISTTQEAMVFCEKPFKHDEQVVSEVVAILPCKCGCVPEIHKTVNGDFRLFCEFCKRVTLYYKNLGVAAAKWNEEMEVINV